eukprot:6037497-Amphidinium_carterae.1
MYVINACSMTYCLVCVWLKSYGTHNRVTSRKARVVVIEQNLNNLALRAACLRDLAVLKIR